MTTPMATSDRKVLDGIAYVVLAAAYLGFLAIVLGDLLAWLGSST